MKEIARLSIPITVWLIGFSAVYALQGFACSRHWPDGVDARALLLGVGALAVFVQGILLLAVLHAPSTSRFVQTTATMLATVALIAALWTMLPVLAASVCH